MVKNDTDLQRDVQDAIRLEPQLKGASVKVVVNKGSVTLTGSVASHALKEAINETVKKVAGTKAVTDRMQVVLEQMAIACDADIKATVEKVLHVHWLVPDSKINVTVKDGWVTLQGKLNWNFQREAALDATRYLVGIKGVLNELKIEAELREEIEKKSVEQALRRDWSIDADKIHVWASGSTITLSGIVNSIHQKDEAERIAWKTPGVWNVINELIVEYD